MSVSGSAPNISTAPLLPRQSSIIVEPDLSCADSWVARAIEKHRVALFILCGLIQLVSFNGQWRIGLDSSLYRGLADALVSGRGYHFGEFATNTAYPGLPVLLAGVQKAFGQNVFAPWPAVVMMMLLSAGTLVVLYQLIRLHYPSWIATVVVFGLAVNSRFVQLSHELLTDIPFLFGTVVALFGWELLRRANTNGRFVRALALCAGGLLLAASMRPTFWVIAVAWLAVAGVNLIRRRDRASASAVAVVLAVVAIVFMLDPRTRSWRIFGGGYEQEFLAVLQDAGADTDSRAPALFTRLAHNIPRLLTENFPESFLGQGLPWGLSTLASLGLFIGVALLFRRHALWALLVFGTVAVTLLLTTTPRYYLMVMPILLLAWLTALLHVRRLLGGGAGELALLLGLALVTVLNLGKVLPFVIEQRTTPFVDSYRNGKFVPTIAMAQQIRSLVPAGQRVIGPQAQVLRFLSGRDVMMQRELLPPRKSPRSYANILVEQQIPFGVLPGDPYREVDPDIARMIDRRVIRSTETLATIAGGWKLCRIQTIAPPAGVDWRELPIQKHAAKKQTAAKLKKTPEQLAASQRREAAARKAAITARKAFVARRDAAARKVAVAERKAFVERKLAAVQRAQRDERRLAAAARERRELVARRAATTQRAERLRRHEVNEARARKTAKERKAKKAATQPLTAITPATFSTRQVAWFAANQSPGHALAVLRVRLKPDCISEANMKFQTHIELLHSRLHLTGSAMIDSSGVLQIIGDQADNADTEVREGELAFYDNPHARRQPG